MKRALLVYVVLAIATGTGGANAQSADVLLNCSACHIVKSDPKDATQRVPSVYPDLRGQPARYLERQLQAYLTGTREHRQMHQTAVALDDGDAAMARLYADAPVPNLEFAGERADHDMAIKLIEIGDWTRGIAPCSSCHSLAQDDRARLAPRLHGQPASYTNAQLQAYAEGTRASDPMGRMRAFASQLTSLEMSALARYYAAWGAPVTTAEQDND